ncbi:MAG: hypothetical protein QOF60_371 [Actinomycetota bacterium]|nr:hypothetical protein [Actinomycetota bacterium]
MSSAAALVLAAVFVWAAVAKVRGRDATVASFRGLGLPGPGVLAVVVPVVEIGLAVGLVVMPSVAGWLALALLAAFTVVIGRAIARGVEVGCACFGSAANDRPVSPLEVVRNAGLAALAVVATGATGDALWPALPAMVVVTVVVALGRVGLAMAELRMTGGHVFSTPLPGEHRR